MAMKMKKWKKVVLIIMAVLVLLTAAVAYFLPVGLIIHTLGVMSKGEDMTEVCLDDTIHFVQKGNYIVFQAEVNGEPDTVIYDSGVNFMFLMMYTPSTSPEGMKFYRNRVTGADKRSSIKMTTMPVKIGRKFGEYKVENGGFGLGILNPEPPLCTDFFVSKYDLIGFQGFDFGPYMIDFTNSEICPVPYPLPIDTTEFVPIKCKIKRGVLWVYPRVNGEEYECIFDTGNGNAGFLLKDEKRVEKPSGNDYVYEGSYGTSIGGHVSNQRYVCAPKEAFSIEGSVKETDVKYVKKLPFNNMGLKAISQYDWVISIYGGTPKVYVRPHVSDEPPVFDFFRYRLLAADGRLTISARLIDGAEKFKVGDQIISVNGEEITEENICHYYNLLTENKDWSGFEIRVK